MAVASLDKREYSEREREREREREERVGFTKSGARYGPCGSASVSYYVIVSWLARDTRNETTLHHMRPYCTHIRR